MRTFEEAPLSTSLPPNFAWKRTLRAVRVLNENVVVYSQVRVSVTRLDWKTLLPFLAVKVIVPAQPCEGETGSGRDDPDGVTEVDEPVGRRLQRGRRAVDGRVEGLRHQGDPHGTHPAGPTCPAPEPLVAAG